MSAAPARAKINLALVVGPSRADGRHEVITILQRVSLEDDVELEPADRLEVVGYEDDTLVATALERLAAAANVRPAWRIRIEKRIPVAAGLGGGSSDAATALSLGNAALAKPLAPAALHEVAAATGSDVPFFIDEGAALASGDGAKVRRIALPTEYWVVLLLPTDEVKGSTRDVYARFDERHGAVGFEERRERLLAVLEQVHEPSDLALLPTNDLASSRHAIALLERGAFRVDVSGAGPTLYGLFDDLDTAARARDELTEIGTTWLVRPI